jgi:hypothetical protein
LKLGRQTTNKLINMANAMLFDLVFYLIVLNEEQDAI